jgi:hypothetical protein
VYQPGSSRELALHRLGDEMKTFTLLSIRQGSDAPLASPREAGHPARSPAAS